MSDSRWVKYAKSPSRSYWFSGLGVLFLLIFSLFFRIELRLGKSNMLEFEEGNFLYTYSRNGYRTRPVFIESYREPRLHFRPLNRLVQTRKGQLHHNGRFVRYAVFVARIWVPLWLPLTIGTLIPVVITVVSKSHQDE